MLPARPSLLRYWYRQSPADLEATGFRDQLLNPGIVVRDDPPTILSGMINVELDPEEQLVPLAIAIFTVDMLSSVPFSGDFSTWSMTTSIFALLSVLTLAGWGFYHSLGGEPVWKVEME